MENSLYIIGVGEDINLDDLKGVASQMGKVNCIEIGSLIKHLDRKDVLRRLHVDPSYENLTAMISADIHYARLRRKGDKSRLAAAIRDLNFSAEDISDYLSVEMGEASGKIKKKVEEKMGKAVQKARITDRFTLDFITADLFENLDEERIISRGAGRDPDYDGLTEQYLDNLHGIYIKEGQKDENYWSDMAEIVERRFTDGFRAYAIKENERESKWYGGIYRRFFQGCHPVEVGFKAAFGAFIGAIPSRRPAIMIGAAVLAGIISSLCAIEPWQDRTGFRKEINACQKALNSQYKTRTG